MADKPKAVKKIKAAGKVAKQKIEKAYGTGKTDPKKTWRKPK